jgi:DNA-binding response OmpR family regulator
VEKVLIIYDDPESQQLVRRILEPVGYDVAIAASDQIGIDVISATKAVLVILDVSLPGKFTQDLCRQIRGESKTVAILVLSSITNVEQVVLLLKLGVDDCITKPFSPSEFMARLRAAMRRRGSAI